MLNRIATTTTALLMLCAAALASSGEHLLTVSGRVDGGPVHLSMHDLRDLPRHTLVTSTAVTDGAHRFTGFLMRDLLDHLGADGDVIRALALNDYVVDIPMRDFRDFDVLVADSMDGTPLRRSNKGPLWIVYPRDDHAELRDIRYDYRWVWQLNRLEIR